MEIEPDMQQALFFFKFQEPLTAINGYKFSQMNREDKHKDIKNVDTLPSCHRAWCTCRNNSSSWC